MFQKNTHTSKTNIKFADFCCGIGGFRLGLEKLSWQCVFSCEIDKSCQKTYQLNFNDFVNANDIFHVNPTSLPYFDVFCAGFPCQPFSIAGKQKGFEEYRGQIIFQILKILQITRTPIVILENVPNLLRHKKGETFSKIVEGFQNINYKVSSKILDSKHFGIPQKRQRLYIVAFSKESAITNFSFTEKIAPEIGFRKFIEKNDFSIPISSKWQYYIDLYTGKKNILDIPFDVPKTRLRLERREKNANLNDCILQMRSSGIRAISLDSPFPTFAVSHSGGGAMIPVYTAERRHLSLIEIIRLMGFPETFKFNVSRTDAIKQLANAVCPPVISSIGRDIEKSSQKSSYIKLETASV